MMREKQYKKGEVVFAQCIGEEPWPAIVTKVIKSAPIPRPIYKVEFINHRSASDLEGERLMKYEQAVKEQTARQKKRGTAGRTVLNAIKAANKMIKKDNMRDQKQRRTESSESDLRQSKSIVKHVLEMQDEEQAWSPARKDPTEEVNRSFMLSAEERRGASEQERQNMQAIQQAEQYFQHSSGCSPNISLDCNLSNTAPDFSISSCKMEEESESIGDIEDIEDIEDMEDMEEHIPNKLDRPKQDLDFSCEQAKLGYILAYLPTAIEVYREMPQPTQIQQFCLILDLMHHRIASRSSRPLSVDQKFEFNTFMRLMSNLQTKPSILSRMVNCVVAYEKNEPHMSSSFSLEYIAMREKLECLCLMKPFVCFPQEAQHILISYIRKCEVNV